jgi:hypothetical protein
VPPRCRGNDAAASGGREMLPLLVPIV